MKKQKRLRIIVFCIASILILLCAVAVCAPRICYDWNRNQAFTSPSGQTTIALRYDYVSRPFLFYKGELIFAYDQAGFAETSFFDVEWITENEIRLYCEQFGEEYFISIQ